MPAEGLDWVPRNHLLTYQELLRLCGLLVRMGIQKIRITGGEPFVRKDMLHFLEELVGLPGLKEVNITTNGVLTAPLIPQLKKIGVHSINFSLDTLDRARFFAIARRDAFPAVWNSIQTALENDMAVKINAVVMEGKNTDDILPLVKLTKKLPIAVRFIEEMPFNGGGWAKSETRWDEPRIRSKIKDGHPDLYKLLDPTSSTSMNYGIPGHRGTVGIIAAYTRSFCGSCNRIRVTPEGMLKTCLYDGGVLNLRDAMRSGRSDNDIKSVLLAALAQRVKTGWEAEQKQAAQFHPSMALIGG